MLNKIVCLRINGIVQGVGFRPFIHQLATKYNLNGWVLNDNMGVLLEVQGKELDIILFKKDIILKKPILSIISNISEKTPKDNNIKYTTFIIRDSINNTRMQTFIPYDASICGDCLTELEDPKNSRYEYPFINCTNCGPRYSIINSMPYDRPNTTMGVFKMCFSCNSEYLNIQNRRYHAQPNACAECGPTIELFMNHKNEFFSGNILKKCGDILRNGDILVVKSLTGFHLAVDASNESSIKMLRVKKRRDSKPFAIMVKDIQCAKKYAYVSRREELLLKSEKRPIVILRKKLNNLNILAPNNPSIGIMLPSAPIHYLLLKYSKLESLVMTSANISGYPIIYQNEEAISMLSNISNYILINNRDIHNRLDDSIIKVITSDYVDNLEIIIRRSRGYAPYTLPAGNQLKTILAVGAEMKTTVSLSNDRNIFLSQFIGDLKNKDSIEFHEKTQNLMINLLNKKPEIYACDMHPYFSSENHHINKYYIQHHHAHMAACMIDNKMRNDNVIGVIYDGTGYGIDGSMWGGEVLVGNYSNFRRLAKLKDIGLIAKDKAVKEPFRIAISLLFNTYGDNINDLDMDFLNNLTEIERNIYFKMAKNEINLTNTSSMGRLFDGISALLNICSKIEYEAQAAIELEGLLERDLTASSSYSYSIVKVNGIYELDYRGIIKDIVNELNNNISVKDISRKFHSTIVDMTIAICEKIRTEYRINKVVLSGGVFMNEYLLSNIYRTKK